MASTQESNVDAKATHRRELQPMRRFNLSEHAMKTLQHGATPSRPPPKHPTTKMINNSSSLKDRRSLARHFRGYFKAGNTLHGVGQRQARQDGGIPNHALQLIPVLQQLQQQEQQHRLVDMYDLDERMHNGRPVVPLSKAAQRSNLLKDALLRRAREAAVTQLQQAVQEDAVPQWQLHADIEKLLYQPGHQIKTNLPRQYRSAAAPQTSPRVRQNTSPNSPFSNIPVQNRSGTPNFHRCVFMPYQSTKCEVQQTPATDVGNVKHNALHGGKSQAVSRQILNKYRKTTCQHTQRPRLRTTACHAHSVPGPANSGNLSFIRVTQPLTLLDHPASAKSIPKVKSSERPEANPRLPELPANWSFMLTQYIGSPQRQQDKYMQQKQSVPSAKES